MKLYRLCTEGTGMMRAHAISATAAVFDSFTVIDAQGYWRGVAEDSVVIEIVAAPEERGKVLALAEDIRAINQQQAVLVQELEVNSGTVVGSL